MDCKRRKIGQACLIDCRGVGDGLAVIPLKKSIEEAIAAGERLFLVNLGGVTRLERAFVQGLNAVRTTAERAEGSLEVFGVNANTRPFFERYSTTLRPYDSEAEALKHLVPEQTVRKELFRIVVLGQDKFQSAAFTGVSHYQNRAVFEFYSSPVTDLAAIMASQPLIVFVNVNVGMSELRHLKQRIVQANKGPFPTFFFALGLPRQESMVQAAITQAGFDDGLMVPFKGEVTMANLDKPAFNKLLGKKIELVLDGFYLQERERKRKFGKV